MSLDTITGQPLAVELCRHWLAKDTTHPLLFYGPVGAGKKALALEVAKALNCSASPQPSPLRERETGKTPFSRQGEGGEARMRRSGPIDSCDDCLSCRKIDAANHPDVRVVDLAWQATVRDEPIEKQQSIRIETIQAERHRLLQSAVEGHWKVSILEDAHRFTPDAGNVLLKILEEPPTRTAIILVTPHRDRLMATILSRCQPVRFRYIDKPVQLSHEEIEAHRVAENLWEALAKEPVSRLIHAAEGRSRVTKASRAETESQIQHLLVPAVRDLRAGDPAAQKPVQLMEKALTQIRQNVQPTLVYDNLLIQLGRHRRSK